MSFDVVKCKRGRYNSIIHSKRRGASMFGDTALRRIINKEDTPLEKD